MGNIDWKDDIEEMKQHMAVNGLTVAPKGTVVTITTNPTELPATPLTGRKWITIRNNSLVDVLLCQENGDVIRTLEPGEDRTYNLSGDVILYAKVISGTASIEVEEGK